jgi:CheY-like chemotaxis protein
MAANKDFKYKSVMIVDDNEIDCLINEKMIGAARFADQIYTYSSGTGALDYLRNIDKNQLSTELIPTLIFLDINMPILDGFQFLDEFEKFSDRIKENTKILMVSSSISPRDIERANDNAHVVKYVNKPLSIKTLEGIAV